MKTTRKYKAIINNYYKNKFGIYYHVFTSVFKYENSCVTQESNKVISGIQQLGKFFQMKLYHSYCTTLVLTNGGYQFTCMINHHKNYLKWWHIYVHIIK